MTKIKEARVKKTALTLTLCLPWDSGEKSVRDRSSFVRESLYSKSFCLVGFKFGATPWSLCPSLLALSHGSLLGVLLDLIWCQGLNWGKLLKACALSAAPFHFLSFPNCIHRKSSWQPCAGWLMDCVEYWAFLKTLWFVVYRLHGLLHSPYQRCR